MRFHMMRFHVDLFAPPKNDFQRVALTFLASQENFQNLKNYTQKMITAPPGQGKAQPNDTIIPTPSGPKRLDKLKIGTMYTIVLENL